MSKEQEPTPKRKSAVVIVRPHYSQHPDYTQYEDYCRQQVLLYLPFRNASEVLSKFSSYSKAYAHSLATGDIQPSLEELLVQQQQCTQEDEQQESHEEQDQQQQQSDSIQPRATE